MSTEVDGSANLAEASWELVMERFTSTDASNADKVLEDNIRARQHLISMIGLNTHDVKDPKVAKVILAAMKDNDASIFSSKRISVEENDANQAEKFRTAFLDVLQSMPNGALPQAGGGRSSDDLELDASIDDFELVEGETTIGDDIYPEGEQPEINVPDAD